MKYNYSKPYQRARLIDEIEWAPTKVEPPPPTEPKSVVVKCSLLNIREQADKSSNVVCIAHAGDKLLLENLVGGWAHIYTNFGIEGYAMNDYLEEV